MLQSTLYALLILSACQHPSVVYELGPPCRQRDQYHIAEMALTLRESRAELRTRAGLVKPGRQKPTRSMTPAILRPATKFVPHHGKRSRHRETVVPSSGVRCRRAGASKGMARGCSQAVLAACARKFPPARRSGNGMSRKCPYCSPTSVIGNDQTTFARSELFSI
jgi:hypothetical protein